MTNIQEKTEIQNEHAEEYGTTRKEKYFFLSSLCRDLEFAIEMDYQTAKYFEDCEKMNDILKKYYSKKYGVEKFNTFKGWKEEGFKVKKGAKGFLFWSKPKKKEKTQEQEESKEKDIKKEKIKYYLSYLFSDAQVMPKKLYEVIFNNNENNFDRCSAFSEKEVLQKMNKLYPNDEITKIVEL